MYYICSKCGEILDDLMFCSHSLACCEDCAEFWASTYAPFISFIEFLEAPYITLKGEKNHFEPQRKTTVSEKIW